MAEVFLTGDARHDLEDLLDFIERHDGADRADTIFHQLQEAVLSLKYFSNRGRVVPELREIGVMDYREILFKPWRVMFFGTAERVYVVAIFDGRRDAEELLRRRLFGN